MNQSRSFKRLRGRTIFKKVRTRLTKDTAVNQQTRVVNRKRFVSLLINARHLMYISVFLLADS